MELASSSTETAPGAWCSIRLCLKSDLCSNYLTREGRRKDVVMWVIVVKKKNPLRDNTA